MTEQTFAKCVRTRVTNPLTSSTHEFILPYEGNLTAHKLDSMADRLTETVAPWYTQLPVEKVTAALRTRLDSGYYAGRYKNVQLVKNAHGNWDLRGEGWSMGNYPAGFFVVVQ